MCKREPVLGLDHHVFDRADGGGLDQAVNAVSSADVERRVIVSSGDSLIVIRVCSKEVFVGGIRVCEVALSSLFGGFLFCFFGGLFVFGFG